MTIRTALFALLLALAPLTARAEAPRVVTDIPPVQSLVARVMQGVALPEVLVPPGVDPHDFAFRPSEAQALASADLVFWVGPALTGWLADPVNALASNAKVVPLLDQGPTLPRRTAAIFAASALSDSPDPHAWLDPRVAADWTAAIAAALIAQDPANADAYRANAAQAALELAALDATIAAQLAPLAGRGLVTAHDSLRYFEARYGLNALGTLTLAEGDRPGPGRIAALRNLIDGGDVVCVTTDPEVSGDWIALLTDGSTASTTKAETMGLGIPKGPRLYTALLLRLAGSLFGCLS